MVTIYDLPCESSNRNNVTVMARGGSRISHWGRQPCCMGRRGADIKCRSVSAKMYAITKELGSVGGGDPPMMALSSRDFSPRIKLLFHMVNRGLVHHTTKETSIASLLGLSNNVTLDIQTLRVVTLSTNSKGRKVCMNGMTDNVSLVTTIPEIFVQNSFCLLMTIRFTVMYCVPCSSAITTVKFVTLYSTFVRILKAFHAPGAVIQQFEYHQTHNGNPRPNQRLDRGSFGKDLNQNYRCDMRLYGERFLDER